MRESVRKAGQRLMVGFHGHEASADVKSMIRDYGAGSVILFARNVASPEQVAELVRELQSEARAAGRAWCRAGAWCSSRGRGSGGGLRPAPGPA